MSDQTGDGSTRIHYLDNLRAIAMLLGVYLHGALAYAEPSRSFWLASNIQGSVAIDASIWLIHLFRMSLFFLLSGYFAKLMIERKGVKTFAWNRGLRIALPFVVFYPLLFILMAVVIVFAIAYVKDPQGLLQLIVAGSKNPEAESPAPTTMHLWFLYYLMMFSVLSLGASQLSWLKFDWLFRRPWLLALVPLVLVPGIMGGGLPVAAPESFIPTWWPFFYYGIFYWAGWQLFGRENLLDRLQPTCWYLVSASLLLFVPHYLMLPKLDITQISQTTATKSMTSYALEAVLASYLSAMLTISALLVGQRMLVRSSVWLKFCADSSYWVYLMHLPIIIFLQTLLIPAELAVGTKLFLVTVATWLFCLATYVVFVRYTPIGWMLHGKRSFP
jgi:glucans biosynthesis protein C